MSVADALKATASGFAAMVMHLPEFGMAVVNVALGSPELLLVILTTLDRIVSYVPFIDPELVGTAVFWALVATFTIYAGRFIARVRSNQ